MFFLEIDLDHSRDTVVLYDVYLLLSISKVALMRNTHSLDTSTLCHTVPEKQKRVTTKQYGRRETTKGIQRGKNK